MSRTPQAAQRSVQAQQRSRLRTARVILWIVGVLTLLVTGIQLADLESTLDRTIDKELRANGGSLAEVRRRPAEERAEFDEAYADALRMARVIGGIALALGIVFLVCGALVYARPLLATATGLILYVLTQLAGLLVEPSTWFHGLLIKALIVMGLVAAVRAAVAYERTRKSGLDEESLRATF